MASCKNDFLCTLTRVLALNSAHLKMLCLARALVLFILVQHYDVEEEKDDNHGISHLLNKKVTVLMTLKVLFTVLAAWVIHAPLHKYFGDSSMVDLNGVQTNNCEIAHILGILLMNRTYNMQIFQATTICCLSRLNCIHLKHVVF